MTAQLERNEENVKAFYDLMVNQSKSAEAVEEYADDVYIQHNPSARDGKDGFIEYFERMAREYPEKPVYFKCVIAEGYYVVLHCFQEWQSAGEWAGIDIFRLHERGKIVEHWDVLQVIPDVSAHGDTMF